MDDRMISYYGKVFKMVEDSLRPSAVCDDLNEELYAADPSPVDAIAAPTEAATLPSGESARVSDDELIEAFDAIRSLTSTQDGTHACAIEAHDRIWHICFDSAKRLLQRITDDALANAKQTLAAD